jgi:hypothetical protein
LSTQGPAAAHGQLALYGARVRTDGTVAVYADGQLVHAAQQQGPLWNSSRTPLWVPLDKTDDGKPPREILIRLEHTRASQVALSSLWLGPADALSWRHSWRHWLQLELPAMFSAAFLAVGIFALFVWLRRRHRTAYLLFFVLAGTSFLRGLHFYIGFPIANDWFAWLTVNSLFWLVATVHVSLVVLHRRKQPWLTGVFITVTVLMGLLTLPVIATLPNTPRVTPRPSRWPAASTPGARGQARPCWWPRARPCAPPSAPATGCCRTTSSAPKAGTWGPGPTRSPSASSARCSTGVMWAQWSRWSVSTPAWPSASRPARLNSS